MKKKYVIQKEDFFDKSFYVTDHAKEQWNNRVFKVNEKQQILNYFLIEVFKHSGFRHDWSDFYVLQNDIVCVLKLERCEITLITVFGRISKNYCLQNVKKMVKSHSKYGNINLDI